MIANACFGRGCEEEAMMTSIAYFHNITGELLKKFYFLPVIKRDAKLVKMRLQNTSDIPIVGVYWNKWRFALCCYDVSNPKYIPYDSPACNHCGNCNEGFGGSGTGVVCLYPFVARQHIACTQQA